MRQFWARKSIDQLLGDSQQPDQHLAKTLGPWSLTALGIGAVVGSGIFTSVGSAIAGEKFDATSILNAPLLDYLVHRNGSLGRPGAGPAIALSMVLVGIVCAFTALCYAELASMIPIAGSAYTYTYATLGELIAWIIGWDLILEYAVSNMAVSVGFASHTVALLDWLGIHIPLRWISPAYLPGGLVDIQGHSLYKPGWHFGFDWPAFLIVALLTILLVRGIRESTQTNNAMVLLKIAAILVFIIAGANFLQPQNWRPFYPNGWSGVLTGGSIIFFSYIGFDSVSTAAEEARNPKRDVPFAILTTLLVCTVLYVGVAVILTGIVPWHNLLDDASPEVKALKMFHLRWAELAVLCGALLGMISSLLVYQMGQARVWFAMSRDGLLPGFLGKIHPRFRTPDVATWLAGLAVAIPAGLLDIGTLFDLSNIGTLFAFVLVSVGVLVLRYREPKRHRSFRVSGGSVVPVLSIVSCLLLMAGLPILTWLRFLVWLAIGLMVYFLYSRHHSDFAGSKLLRYSIPITRSSSDPAGAE